MRTSLQTAIVVLAFATTPFTALAGWEASQWVVSHRHPDCNEQARAWIAQFPDNQPLATMPAFTCKR